MSLSLVIHIASAIATFVVCIFAWYRPSSRIQKMLTYLTIASLGSGFFVSFDQLLNRATCIKLAIYLLVIGLTQYMLRIKTISLDKRIRQSR